MGDELRDKIKRRILDTCYEIEDRLGVCSYCVTEKTYDEIEAMLDRRDEQVKQACKIACGCVALRSDYSADIETIGMCQEAIDAVEVGDV